MQFLTLIPEETKLAILAFVIFPAFAVLSLRSSLHKRLKDMNRRITRLSFGEEEGIKPPIVNKLKTRYEKASKKLEHVNTVALIDSIYKDETLSYLGLKIQFDLAEAITKVLPNLLISFGLIGTFLGISRNLTNISSIVTNNSEIGQLAKGLHQPLQDMGIAFSTSLFGLLFGSILTVFNTFWNTSIAKYQLLSCLEDYLDNVYKPTIPGNTRLDTAIDRMVKQQQEFLLRFHEKVGEVLEKSFGNAADRIASECSKTNKIAEDVYTSFANAAGTISTGATTFEQAANSLKNHDLVLTDLLIEFKGGVEIFKIAANQIAHNKFTENNIVDGLNVIVRNLGNIQDEFTNSNNILVNGLGSISTNQEQLSQLTRQIYQGLETTTANLQDAVNNFTITQREFSQSTVAFSQASQEIQPLITKLSPLMVSVDRAVNTLQQLSEELANFDRKNLQPLDSTRVAKSDLDILSFQNAKDRESLARLSSILERMESRLNTKSKWYKRYYVIF